MTTPRAVTRRPPAATRRITFAVGAPVHISGWRTWFAQALGILPIDSDRHIRDSLQTSAALLKEGQVLVIFPEGSRSYDGRLGVLRDGSAVLAGELGLPIVPCAIDGAFEAWPRGRRLPRPHPIEVRFGPPIHPTNGPDGSAEPPAELTARLEAALRALGVE